jgi:hypothetical protein
VPPTREALTVTLTLELTLSSAIVKLTFDPSIKLIVSLDPTRLPPFSMLTTETAFASNVPDPSIYVHVTVEVS